MENRLMKRIISAAFILCLLSTGFIRCYAESLREEVSELYNAEGIYTDSIGNQGRYSYHVPKISADTSGAREINDEIAKKYAKLAEEQFHLMEKGLSVWCWNIGWQAFWHDNQVFLLLRANEPNDLIEYAAYGYDCDTGERITNKMILQQHGIREEEYLENLKEAAKALFVKMNSGIPKDKLEESSYDELLNRTLQWQTMDQPMYMDQDGELTTIAEIGVFAGAGSYKQLVRAFEHNINLVGDSNLLESCPKTARTGETVTILTYDITDGDKVIEVSGADVVRVNWIEYQFVMPPHDVDVKVKFIGNGLA